MLSSENLDYLNDGGWGGGVLIAIVVDGTPDSPVVHRTWHCSVSGACHVNYSLGLERLTIGVLCLLATPDSPVAHQTCPVRSDFAALTSDFCTMRFLLFTQSTVGAVDRCSTGSLDMSGVHRTVQ
jgi:hypothetical protein